MDYEWVWVWLERGEMDSPFGLVEFYLGTVGNFQFEPQKRRGGASQARQRPFKQVPKSAADATGKARVPS